MKRGEEIKMKLKRVRELLKEKDLNAVLFKKQPNFFWITAGGANFVSIASEIGACSVLITEKEQYVIANMIEYPRIKDEELKGLDFKFITYEWYEDKELEIIKKIAGKNKIGSDTYIPEFLLIENSIKKLRYELTEGEIERYCYLGENLSNIVENTVFQIKKDMAEIEIAGMISKELWKCNIQPTGFMIAADERVSDYRHPIATEKRVKKKITVSVNARYKGLITTVTRMGYLGKIPDSLKRQYLDNIEIECIMMSETKIGEKINKPLLKAIEEYGKRGYKDEWKRHHQGGSMGYYPRDIRVTQTTDEIAYKNQAFCWNPTISGTKTEDGFIITEKGKIMITKPIIFPKLEIKVAGETFFRPDIVEI